MIFFLKKRNRDSFKLHLVRKYWLVFSTWPYY